MRVQLPYVLGQLQRRPESPPQQKPLQMSCERQTMPECDHELQLDPWCCWEKALFSLIHLPPTFWNKTLLALCTPSLLRLVVPASRGRTQHLLLHPQKRPCGPSAPPSKAHAVSVHPSPSLPGISRVLHPFQRRGPPTAWARPRYPAATGHLCALVASSHSSGPGLVSFSDSSSSS